MSSVVYVGPSSGGYHIYPKNWINHTGEVGTEAHFVADNGYTMDSAEFSEAELAWFSSNVWFRVLATDGGGGVTTVAPVPAYPLSEYEMFTCAFDPLLTNQSSSMSPGFVKLPVPAGWQIEGIRYAVSATDIDGTILSGFAVYEEGSPSARVGYTTGAAWGVTGWRSLALNSVVASQSVDRMVNLAFCNTGGNGTLNVQWYGAGNPTWANSGIKRRSVYGLSFGSAWPSTFNFETGGTENGWLPLFGLYGTKVA